MRMRYYLRGLGIGIVITALLMGFTKGGQKETLTDAEIVERAKSLGMVESSVLSADLGDKQEISVNDIAEADPQEEIRDIESETETDILQQAETEAETVDSEQAEPGAETDDSEQAEPDAETQNNEQSSEDATEKRYVVTIYSGDGSRAVANRLEEMGAIEDAAEFDRYLCQNGYDKRLTTGNHEINAGADEKEIAEALVKRVN